MFAGKREEKLFVVDFYASFNAVLAVPGAYEIVSQLCCPRSR
jgi:hypothetical protein